MSYKLENSDWARIGSFEDNWVCGICGNEFRTELDLEEHINDKHSTIIRRKLRS